MYTHIYIYIYEDSLVLMEKERVLARNSGDPRLLIDIAINNIAINNSY